MLLEQRLHQQRHNTHVCLYPVQKSGRVACYPTHSPHLWQRLVEDQDGHQQWGRHLPVVVVSFYLHNKVRVGQERRLISKLFKCDGTLGKGLWGWEDEWGGGEEGRKGGGEGGGRGGGRGGGNEREEEVEWGGRRKVMSGEGGEE